MESKEQREQAYRGVLFAGGAYFLWGIFPLFWRELKGVDATELIAHRVVWSLFFVLALSYFLGSWEDVKRAFASPRLVGLHLLSGAMLTVNWLVYVWGVNSGRVLEMSLGYFLVPLLNAGLGKLVLREHLRPVQWCALALAGVGILCQFTALRDFPWAALTIALSWGFYALMRKRSPLDSVAGLAVETALFTPLAGAFLVWKAWHGLGALGHSDSWVTFLVFSTGIVTAIPLIFFAAGARRLRFTTLGLLQYLSPSMTFLLGAFLYHEALTNGKIVSFGLIWLALVLYSIDGLLRSRFGIAAAPAAATQRR